MSKPKILFVSQEIEPYLKETEMSKVGRFLPQGIQERGKEVRAFMPRFGLVNERRHQLHEVIRLSGLNLVVNDLDHPLIIKVASIQAARMQVYFIDNEEFFKRKATFQDKSGKMFEDNDERAIFFVRGVLETVKKLGWSPDIIHCHGWMTSILPTYLKTFYNDDPLFSDTKTVYSVYNHHPEKPLHDGMIDKVKFDEIDGDAVSLLQNPSYINLHKQAVKDSDAVVAGTSEIPTEIEADIKESRKPFMTYTEYADDDSYYEKFSAFYDEILNENTVSADAE